MDKKEKYEVFAANFNSEVIAIFDAQEDEPEDVNYKKGDIGILSFLNYSEMISANAGGESEEWPFGITFKEGNSYFLFWDMSSFSLLKKPLEKISDDDAIELCKLNHFAKECHCVETGKKIIEGMFDYSKSIHNVTYFEALKTLEFLREKNYALPYKNWSVEQLVEFGIYKLID